MLFLANRLEQPRQAVHYDIKVARHMSGAKHYVQSFEPQKGIDLVKESQTDHNELQAFVMEPAVSEGQGFHKSSCGHPTRNLMRP